MTVCTIAHILKSIQKKVQWKKKKRVATEYMGICGGGEELENYESWLHYCKAVTLCVSDKTTQTVHKKGSNLGLWLYLR